VPVALGSRPFDLLMALAGHAGELVSKEWLLENVWPGLVVEESNLQVQVSALRKAIGPKVIATVPGHGYRFEQPVERLGATPPAAARAVAIPQPLSSLVGRQSEIESIRSLLDQHRLVTLKGTGGIGKTRLAVGVGHEIAKDATHDIWFVDLSALYDGAGLPQAMLTAIGAVADLRAPALESVQRKLAEGTCLVILDNCEQVVASAAAACRTLLEGCPGLKFLCTSREPLHVPGEVVCPVLPLAEADAITLFLDRARAVCPALQDTEESRALIGSIVRRLEGISLALELAAARLGGMSLADLAAQIDDRFRLLTSRDRTALPRHRALRSTLEWSYQLLSAPEQQLFRRLAAFTGPFGAEEVAAVAAEDGMSRVEVVDLLAGLADKSLVQCDPNAPACGYSLFESTRSFAQATLERAGETDRIRRHHFDHYFERVSGIRQYRYSPEWPSLRAWLRPALPNLVAALRWGLLEENDIERGAAMAGNMIHAWLPFGLHDEAEQWLSMAYRHLSRLSGITAARLHRQLGVLFHNTGRTRKAESHLRESLAIYSTLEGPIHEVAGTLETLGSSLFYRRDYRAAVTELEKARALFNRAADRRGEGSTLMSLGTVHLSMDRIDVAERRMLEAAELLGRAEQGHSAAMCQAWLAECASARGAPAEGLMHAQRAMEHFRAEPDSQGTASVHARIARCAVDLGDLPLARSSMLESLRIVSRVRHHRGVSTCLDICVSLAMAAGKPGDGACLEGFVDHWRRGDLDLARPAYAERRAAQIDATLREALEPQEYERQYASGTKLSVDEALALARSITESLPS
jgi:non-specific serine/threonine protein kinase